MSVRISVSAPINASASEAWAALENIESHVLWMKDAESIRFTTPERTGIGTEFICVTKVGPIRLTDAMSVTEWKPCEAMGVHHRGVVKGSGRFTLRSLDGGETQFSWDEQLTFPWWLGGPLGERLARPILERLWRGNVARLKAVIEKRR
ncbi:MAG: SRPBCC family protein [Acidimicrobiales bacterium]|jgi:hypothetical protein